MKIRDYQPSDKATLILRLTECQIRKTPANAEYASMIGYDGSDLIDVKIWALTDEIKSQLKNGEIYELSGVMKDYQGKMQFNVKELRLVGDDEVDKSVFYATAKMTEAELKDAIEAYVGKIENDVIRTTVATALARYADYYTHPAAVMMHHNYISGLAYHTYSMLRISDAYLAHYLFLNKDLVYGGIILHDIGKLVELSDAKSMEYTKKGQFLGHIAIASNILHSVATELGYEDTEEVLMLQHIILSHHGLLEYGSPKEPATAEALLVFLLDFADSRLAALEKEMENTEKGEYTNFISALDRKSFYKPKI